MGLSLSTTMINILGAAARDVQYTIEVSFPDASVLRFATAPLTIAGNAYSNELESVKEIRRTLESPTDRVGVALQNKDHVIGLHVEANRAKWLKAEAVIGRLYRDAVGLGLSQWIEMFRGSIQQPIVNDPQVTFEIIDDTLTPGDIVARRNLAPPCPFVFKDAKTCAYAGAGTLCDHHLKSAGGCEGYANTHHYGGMEHRQNPDSSIPGTGGNQLPSDDLPGDHNGIPCPRPDQYVRVKGPDGRPLSIMAGEMTLENEIWHPIKRRYFPLRTVRIVKDQPIWEIVAANGASGESSLWHPIIRSIDDHAGKPVSQSDTYRTDRRSI
ncbi:MAG: hypothetical protein ABI539_02770, partial [Acidobacteriota bacterium]